MVTRKDLVCPTFLTIFDGQFLFQCLQFGQVISALTLIDHFTVSCLVAWPLNESEAGGDLVLIETSLLFSC